MIHFNPRFNHLGDVKKVVMNSVVGTVFGEEIKESRFLFYQGAEATMTFFFNAKEILVKIPGEDMIKFPNRLGLDTVQFVLVEGDFKLTSISFD
uniref:Galectin n=1 Tax=Sphenodon punctatus TaxID=8508 RepID=A0A8D0H2F0_SPHPU